MSINSAHYILVDEASGKVIDRAEFTHNGDIGPGRQAKEQFDLMFPQRKQMNQRLYVLMGGE